MELDKLIEHTEALTAEIKSSNKYKEYISCKNKVVDLLINGELKNEYKRLCLLQEKARECLKYSEHHPDYQETKNEIKSIVNGFLSNSIYKEFKNSELIFELYIKGIFNEIKLSVSKDIKLDNLF